MMKKFKLSELGEFKNGANYPKGSYGSGDKIVNVKDLFQGRFVKEDNLDELKKDALNNKEIYLVEDGDILFTRSSLVRSGAGMCAMINKPSRDIIFCGFIIRYRVNKENVNPLYLLYLLRSPQYRALFTGNQQTNITNINQDTLGGIEVELPVDENGNPDIDRQNEIISILDNIDIVIENNETSNDILEDYSKLLYNYWFLQFEFPDINGNPYKSSGGKMVFNNEFNMEIPEGWEIKELGKIITELESGDRPKGGACLEGIPSIGAENIISIGKYDFESDKYIPKEYFNEMNSGIVKDWDILLYKDGAGIGQVSMAGDGFPHSKCAVNSHVFIIRSKDCKYQNYLYLTLGLPHITKILIYLGMKAAQPGLNKPSVKSIKILVPPDEVIDLFNEKCNNIFHKIFNQANQNKSLVELKKFLIPLIFNGQIKPR